MDQYADNATDNDDASFSDESRNEGEITYEIPSSIATADSSNTSVAVTSKTPVTPTTVHSSATPVVGSATPLPESHIIFHKSTGSFVYALAKDVNIFEERVPSGSKRVKKKRKFFGYDEHAERSIKSE